jgi:hypothetical protein
MDFQSTDTVFTCKQDMESIGTCETCYLPSADHDCSVTLHASQSFEEGTDKQISKSKTDTKGTTTIDGGEKNDQDEFEIGVKGSVQIPILGTGHFGLEVNSRYRHQVSVIPTLIKLCTH